VDDDGDGQVDEGNVADDDEDGRVDEDWLDPVVFHLQGSTLIERDPVPWDTNGDGVLDGRDWVEQPLAEGVSTFRIERVLSGENRSVLVDITLELTASNGDKVSFERRVRLGGRL